MFVSGIKAKGKLKMGCSTDKVSIIFNDSVINKIQTQEENKMFHVPHKW
jgi:hypothetical protein